MPDYLQPHGLQHARAPCPSPTLEACSKSCPLSWWCHPTISFSVIPFFSSCLHSFPASGSFPMSQFFTSGGQSIVVSALASVLPMNIQDWFPLGLTGLISSQSQGLFSYLHNSKHWMPHGLSIWIPFLFTLTLLFSSSFLALINIHYWRHPQFFFQSKLLPWHQFCVFNSLVNISTWLSKNVLKSYMSTTEPRFPSLVFQQGCPLQSWEWQLHPSSSWSQIPWSYLDFFLFRAFTSPLSANRLCLSLPSNNLLLPLPLSH